MTSSSKATVVSFSGGKDSTAMVHKMLENNQPIDEVIFFDGGWEFPELYDHIELFEKKTGLTVTVVKPEHSFDYYLYDYKFKKRGPEYKYTGFGFPWARGRWCTRYKIDALKKYCKKFNGNFTTAVGIAYDEIGRLEKNGNIKTDRIYPLIQYKMTEKDCLEYCYNLGYRWGGGTKSGIDYLAIVAHCRVRRTCLSCI